MDDLATCSKGTEMYSRSRCVSSLLTVAWLAPSSACGNLEDSALPSDPVAQQIEHDNSRPLASEVADSAGLLRQQSTHDLDTGTVVVSQRQVSRPANRDDLYDDELSHVLRDTAVEGRHPVYDVQDTPDGKRYAVVFGKVVDEDGNATELNGLWALDREVVREPARPRTPGRSDETYRQRPNDIEVDKIEPALSEQLQGREGSDLVRIMVTLPSQGQQRFLEMERRVALGEAITTDDMMDLRQATLENHRQRVAVAQIPVVAKIRELGGVVVRQLLNLNVIYADMPVATLEELAERIDVVRIGGESPVTEDGDADGYKVRVIHQTKQYSDRSPYWDGDGPSTTVSTDDATGSVIETKDLNSSHVGFREGDGSNFTRFRGLFRCDGNSAADCDTQTSMTAPVGSDHATAVTGIVIGDCLDQQCGVILDAQERSGYSPEGRSYFYSTVNADTGDVVAGLDHIPGNFYHSNVVNLSLGVGNTESNCAGTSNGSLAMNAIYELGTLPIKTAGNELPTSSTDCSCSSGAAAISAFTVGAHGQAWTVGTDWEDYMRGSFIWYDPTPPSPLDPMGSSRGGNPAAPITDEGRGRTIVDLMAFHTQARRFTGPGGWMPSGTGVYGTSMAAPIVAAAALDFVDWWHSLSGGAWIDDNPGALFAALLAMGDRQNGTYTTSDGSSRMTKGYNRYYGAGRMKMRFFDDFGMDTPWGWFMIGVCVGDGENVNYSLGTIPSTVDYLKVVSYTYDEGHGLGQALDDVNLHLLEGSGDIVDGSPYEEKERIFRGTSIAGKAATIRLFGNNVHGGAGTVCGVDSRLTYVVAYWEDGARNDTNGPCADPIGTACSCSSGPCATMPVEAENAY